MISASPILIRGNFLPATAKQREDGTRLPRRLRLLAMTVSVDVTTLVTVTLSVNKGGRGRLGVAMRAGLRLARCGTWHPPGSLSKSSASASARVSRPSGD
ncbi:MAG: hypothetical protein V5B30_20855 [Candidatus Accumulibacter delftensis]|jgi:hypothetical protein